METQTRIANVIASVSDQAKYDHSVKAVLANTSILAWVMKCCVDEFRPYDLATIAGCIQGKPDIATKTVHRNEADASVLNGNDEITADNSEDSSITESKITYDVRFRATVPGTQTAVELIINVEAQKDEPSYKIEKRVIYYLSRLISGQYGTVFSHSDYDKIEKVYSIWLCIDVADYVKNTITKITLNHEAVYGPARLRPDVVDLMQGVIVNLGTPETKTGNSILDLMNTLLSCAVSADKKKRVLQEDFKIAMTEEIESEVSEMCNLSQSAINYGIAQGIERGIAQGMERGIAQGMERGIAQGMERGIAQGMERGIAQGMERGISQGELGKARQTAKNLYKMGMPIHQIAEAVDVAENIVTGWLNEPHAD